MGHKIVMLMAIVKTTLTKHRVFRLILAIPRSNNSPICIVFGISRSLCYRFVKNSVLQYRLNFHTLPGSRWKKPIMQPCNIIECCKHLMKPRTITHVFINPCMLLSLSIYYFVICQDTDTIHRLFLHIPWHFYHIYWIMEDSTLARRLLNEFVFFCLHFCIKDLHGTLKSPWNLHIEVHYWTSRRIDVCL